MAIDGPSDPEAGPAPRLYDTDMSEPDVDRAPLPLPVGGIVLAWLAAIGIDFLAYGGVFAGLFADGDPTVLTSSQLFQRIPAGYASFLVEIVLLVWLMQRTSTTEPTGAVRLGGLVGLGFGAALVLGVWSFSPTSVALLVSWWLVLVMQMSFAGWVIATWSGGKRRIVRTVVALVIVGSVIAGVVIQNIAG